MLYQPDMMHRDELCGASIARVGEFRDAKIPPGARPPGLSPSFGATPRSALRGVVRFGLVLLTVKEVLHGLIELLTHN